MIRTLVRLSAVLCLLKPAGVTGAELDVLPVPVGGDPVGIWDADSLDIDVFTSPTLRAAISDLSLNGFVDGQISVGSDMTYRFEYVVDVDVSLTFLGGPVAVSLVDTVQETGTYSVSDEYLILAPAGATTQDTVGFSADSDTLRLIEAVPLGEFAALVTSVDPEGGPPLAVLKLKKVSTGIVSADFDSDGVVGFTDFLAFAGSFGSRSGEIGWDARFDLDGDSSVGFTDFLVFVSLYTG